MRNTLTKPNWKEARQFVKRIVGAKDPVVCIQVFDDKGKDDIVAANRHGRLSDVDLQKWLFGKAQRGCGVYLTANCTDGHGRARANMVEARVLFVDLDKADLPTEFPLRRPDIIVRSSPGRHWLFWIISRPRISMLGLIVRSGSRPTTAATRAYANRPASCGFPASTTKRRAPSVRGS
jgi:hypothetical protein